MYAARCCIGVCMFSVALGSSCAAQKNNDDLRVKTSYQEPIHNANYPELLYWFVTPETLNPATYTHDVEHIAHDTVFDFPFLTQRNGVQFSDSKEAHNAIAGIVTKAHQEGLRVGATIMVQSVGTLRTFPLDDDQTVVSEAENTLDADGRGILESSVKLRVLDPLKTELLRVVAFRKVGPGEFDPSTLTDVTAKAKEGGAKPGTISIQMDLGPKFAGYTVFAMATTWYNALDLFSDAHTRWIHEAIDQYRDVPLDGYLSGRIRLHEIAFAVD